MDDSPGGGGSPTRGGDYDSLSFRSDSDLESPGPGAGPDVSFPEPAPVPAPEGEPVEGELGTAPASGGASAPPPLQINAGFTFAPQVHVHAPNVSVQFNVSSGANAPSVQFSPIVGRGPSGQVSLPPSTERVDVLLGVRGDIWARPSTVEGGPPAPPAPLNALQRLMKAKQVCCIDPQLALPSPLDKAPRLSLPPASFSTCTAPAMHVPQRRAADHLDLSRARSPHLSFLQTRKRVETGRKRSACARHRRVRVHFGAHDAAGWRNRRRVPRV